MLRKNKISKLGPVMDYNDKLLTDDLTKAEHFNDFFINVTESLTTKLNPLDESTLSTFVTRITPTKDCSDIDWELVRSITQKRIRKGCGSRSGLTKGPLLGAD